MNIIDEIIDFFKWFFDFILDAIFNGIIAILSKVPVPDFLGDMTANASNITGISAYYLSVFEIGNGVKIILAAYLIRFLIRRIPIIG